MTFPQPSPLPFRTTSPTPASPDLAVALLGPSTAMAQLWGQVRRIAPHLRAALLTGAADCGQEAVARVLLDLSPNPRRSFFQLSAAEAETRLLRPAGLTAIPADLFLFIPDVHRYSAEAQRSLLQLMRMRRSRAFTVVAATVEELGSLVAVGRFSAELADALSSVRVTVPSLRERVEDLPMLLAHLLETHRTDRNRPILKPTEPFLRAAMAHPWSGNFRELVRVVEAFCASARSEAELSAEDLEKVLAEQSRKSSAETMPIRMVSLDTVVQEHIGAVLRACRGNKLRAAEILGISRSTLYRMLDAASARNPSLPLAS